MAEKDQNLVSERLASLKHPAKVPSDIEISQSIEPFCITKVAAEAGILPSELEPYGSEDLIFVSAPSLHVKIRVASHI